MSIEQEFKDGFLEIYQEFYTDTIEYYRLKDADGGIYGERREQDRTYDEPVFLVGKVETVVPSGKDRDDRGRTANLFLNISVPTKSLEVNGLTEDFNLRELRKGKMRYKDRDYRITNIDLDIFLGNDNMMYIFEVKGEY